VTDPARSRIVPARAVDGGAAVCHTEGRRKAGELRPSGRNRSLGALLAEGRGSAPILLAHELASPPDSTSMDRLVSVTSREDIFPHLRDTPIGRLLEFHN